MDLDLKEQVALLYQQLGTSFPEAARIFAKKSVEHHAMPFQMHLSSSKQKRKLGIANEKYIISNNIDEWNDDLVNGTCSKA